MPVNALTMRHVFQPLALVHITSDMLELSLALCFVEGPLTLISSPVRPLLHTRTVTQVSQPLTSVGGTIAEGVLHTLLGCPSVTLILNSVSLVALQADAG